MCGNIKPPNSAAYLWGAAPVQQLAGGGIVWSALKLIHLQEGDLCVCISCEKVLQHALTSKQDIYSVII